MDTDIISRGVILKRAEEAAQKHDSPYIDPYWPIGTHAGQIFVQEFHAARAKRQAAERLQQEA